MSIFSPAAATLEEPDGIALLRSARLYNKERHERRVSLLHQHHKNCHDKATIRMLNVIKSDEGKQARMENLIKKLQSNLTALSLLFLKIVEAEQGLGTKRLQYETKLVGEQVHHMKLSHRMALFCLHIEHETRGSIVVKKLTPNHPQYIRCLRAATENVKKDFFSAKDAKYTGVEVQNVYKIENRILLDSFQSSAATSDPGKVKGLFCRVPIDCLETSIVYGVNGRPKDGSSAQHAFQDTWYDTYQAADNLINKYSKTSNTNSSTNLDASSAGYARKAVDRGSAIPFPRCFSRHSTLEEDREFISQSHNGDNNSSNFRFLALCRVMIGKILVTSKNSNTKGFPPVQDDCYDSIYSPSQEEYKLLNENYVLPEFLVQYKFIPRSCGEEAEMENDAKAGVEAGVEAGAEAGAERGVMDTDTNSKKEVASSCLFEIDLQNTKITIPHYDFASDIKSKDSILAFNVGRGMNERVSVVGDSNSNGKLWTKYKENATRQKSYIYKSIDSAFHEFHDIYNQLKVKLWEK